MNKFTEITNEELINEIEKRLPDFTERDIIKLMVLLLNCRKEITQTVQEVNPQIHQWFQEKKEQFEQEKKIKEFLKKKENK